MMDALKILVITPTLPKPDVASGDRRLLEILTILAHRHSVDLLTLDSPRQEAGGGAENDHQRYLDQFEQIGVKVLDGGGDSPIHRVLATRTFDVGLFEFWACAEWVADGFRQRQPWARVIVDTVDVNFLREQSGLALGVSEPSVVEANKAREIATYRQADAVIVLTLEDREALENCGDMPRQFLIPNIVNGRPREDHPRNKELLFVGGFKHTPNLDGLLWFVRSVWPAIRSAVPDARLTIVGSYPSTEILDLDTIEGIEVVGYVPDTHPYLDRAAISVAPLRFGAGMKGKVVEAMASGLPVVTTTVGAQGLDAISGKQLVIADDPDEFARGVVNLLQDQVRAREMGQAGKDHVAAICSSAVVIRQIEEMLAYVGALERPSVPSSRLIRSAWVLSRRLRHKASQIVRKLSGRLVKGSPFSG